MNFGLGLVGKKVGMTRVFLDDGSAVPVSVLKIDDARVVQKKTMEVDGYRSIQVTTGAKLNKKGEMKLKRVSSALKGHYAKSQQNIGLGLWEFRLRDDFDGEIVDLNLLSAGCFVDVQGVSKGKGFQGGVKRHNFSMQDATHGNSVSHRAIGSTGQCQNPGKVFKGKKMAGHMGSETVNVENLEVIKVDLDRKLLLVKGAIPGAKTGFVKVYLSHKKSIVNEKVLSEVAKTKSQEEQAITE